MQPNAARDTPLSKPSKVSAGERCLRSWRRMSARHIGPCTRSASSMQFTYYTRFKRSRREASRRLKEKLNWSTSGSPRQNRTTEKGRTEMKKNNKIRIKEGSGNVFADL